MQKDAWVFKAPMNVWILHTVNVELFDYKSETWVAEAISKGMKRHQNANVLIVEE